MSNTVTGQIIKIGEIETKNNFSKRIVIIQTEDKYPQKLPLELFGKVITETPNLQEGDMITASVNINGKEWNDKIFVSLNAWKIQKNN